MTQFKLSVKKILSLSALILCGSSIGTANSAAAETEATGTSCGGKHFTGFSHYYHDRFHGRRTASGQAHDKFKFTAAHRTLPFGTHLEVTNKRNGKKCIVTVNDRGPFTKSVCLDLSKAAAQKLNFHGGKLPIECRIVEPKVAALFLKQQAMEAADSAAMPKEETAVAAKPAPTTVAAKPAAAVKQTVLAAEPVPMIIVQSKPAEPVPATIAEKPATPATTVAAKPSVPVTQRPTSIASITSKAPTDSPNAMAVAKPAPKAVPSSPEVPAISESTFLLVINDTLEAEVEQTSAARTPAASMTDAVDFERGGASPNRKGALHAPASKLADIKNDPTL